MKMWVYFHDMTERYLRIHHHREPRRQESLDNADIADGIPHTLYQAVAAAP